MTDLIDAREGLSAELLDLLGAADRVVIGLKDQRTAVLWLGRDSDGCYAVVPAIVHRQPRAALVDEQPLVIDDARHDLYWRTAIDALRTGMVIAVEWALGWAAVSLRVGQRQPEPRCWQMSDYRSVTVRLPAADLWPRLGPSGTRRTSYPLGVTTNRRRQRLGEALIVRGPRR